MSPTPQRLQITAASPDPALLDLPWHIPLEDWPSETLAAIRATPPAGCGGATLSGSGPTVIAWASDGAACAADLRLRFPDHEILELGIAPRGAL